MATEHPINPPSLAVIKKWIITNGLTVSIAEASAIASLASRLGADQELEACCEWVVNTHTYYMTPGGLRAARRPKPPSLKEQALAALDDAIMRGDCITISDALPTLRRALEALPND